MDINNTEETGGLVIIQKKRKGMQQYRRKIKIINRIEEKEGSVIVRKTKKDR